MIIKGSKYNFQLNGYSTASLFITIFLIVLFCSAFLNLASAQHTLKLDNNSTGLILLEQDRTGMTVKLEIGEINFIPVSTLKNGSYILATVDGFTRSHKIGEPCLPVSNKLLSIPFGCDLKTTVLDYKIEEISLTSFGLTDPIIPVQPPLSKSENPATIPFEHNKHIYALKNYYTLPLVKAEVLGIMRNMRFGMVSIAPIEYNPSGNTIKVYTDITVRINYENSALSTTEKINKSYYSPFFNPAYNRTLNYDPSADADKDDLANYPVKYLIISDRMFESQLQPFIEWKTKKGFNVITAYTDVIGASNTAIKAYIENMYYAATEEDPAPSFVLFVGDAQQIPPFDGSAGSHITDLYFCEFTGDNFPEIYYGRFSAQNTDQLQPQIDKTLEYEKFEMPDPSYLADVTMVSGVDPYNASTYGNGQINYGTNIYFNAAHGISSNTWLYPDSAQTGAASAIIETVNEGTGFYNYTAHCDHDGPQSPSFSTNDILGLTNMDKYLLGIGNCCLSNTFGANYVTPCFGETWLQAEDKGGIGWIGGSNSTYWDEDYSWGVGNGPIMGSGPSYEETGLGVYDGIFHDHGEPVMYHYITNSAIIFCGNLAVTESGSIRSQYYWEIYHLMGDPSVMTFLGMPAANTVNHPAALSIDAISLTVYATPGSYVGISLNGDLHGAGYIDDSGQVEISLDPFGDTGTADIIVTAQNKIPYMSTILVIPSGPAIIPTAPSAGDIFYMGETITTTWQTFEPEEIPDVMIELSLDNGNSFTILESSIPNVDTYTFPAPIAESEECLIRISDATDGDSSGTTGQFSIAVNYEPCELTDIDLDGDVDGSDLAIFSSAFGSIFGDINYNENADFFDDESIDENDLVIFAENFGKICFITFKDPQLEAKVREILGIDELTPITPALALTLTELDAARSDIEYIDGLEHCYNLESLDLHDNSISDINPLVSNSGLGASDSIYLRNNYLDFDDCPDIDTLISRGAYVYHDVTCP
ncbi:MAG: C25 family cysteine peptidase [bacterium]